MVTYNVVLFFHLLGVAALFAAIGLIQVAGAGVRRARSVSEARIWLRILRVTGPMFGIAFLLILAAGLYMTVDVWTFKTSWVDVALVTVGIMIVVGGAVVARRLRNLGAAAAQAQEDQMSAGLRTAIADPVLWTSTFSLAGMAIGVLWLMTNKPGWVESILVVVVLGAIAAAAGNMVLRRGTTPASQ